MKGKEEARVRNDGSHKSQRKLQNLLILPPSEGTIY